MALHITPRLTGGNVVLDLSGRLCFLETSLREQVIGFLGQGHRDFVLNLTEVSYLDSFGLGQLVSVWTSIRNKNGQMKLLQPNERVRTLLRITKLDTVFQIDSTQVPAS